MIQKPYSNSKIKCTVAVLMRVDKEVDDSYRALDTFGTKSKQSALQEAYMSKIDRSTSEGARDI